MTDEIWEEEILKSSGSFQKRDPLYLEVFQILYRQTDWVDILVERLFVHLSDSSMENSFLFHNFCAR